MAKKEETKKENTPETSKEEVKLNDLFQDIYKKISMGAYEMDIEKNKNQIDAMSEKIRKVIDSDMDEMKSYGGENDLTRFLLNTIQKSGRNFSNLGDIKTDNMTLENLFLSKDGSIFSTFEERFRNKSLLFHDLEIITEQLVELNEAINTTRDDIIASDDVGSEISRSLSFSVDGKDNDKYDELIEEVKEIEKKYGLNYMVREHIVPKTLKYGEYYVYIIPERTYLKTGKEEK